MPYKDNSNMLDSARRRIEDVLASLDLEKILPERYHQRHSSNGALHLDEEDLGYTSEGPYNVYPLMYNLLVSIEDYSNDSKALYKNGMLLYLVDNLKVKFFYERTENKLSNPAAIYNRKNKQVNFNANVINSMEEESLGNMLKFISVLNYIIHMKG
ncbi:MAG: hypothetical protein M1580_02295 [Candidatus Parvarchaeota archaeon]|nr:hypothetical protein [Candidatus Parvarchaeota archaeon]